MDMAVEVGEEAEEEVEGTEMAARREGGVRRDTIPWTRTKEETDNGAVTLHI